MAITIDNAFVQTFESIVRQLAQQKMSKLRGCVQERNRQSEAHNWDRLAASAALLKTARASSPAGGDGSGAIDTTDGLAWSRRKTLIKSYHWGEIVSQEELNQMIIDPIGSVADNGAMAMNRTVDDIIIAAATGDALDGDGSGVSLLAGQTIGDGTTAMSMAVLKDTQELFAENDIDPDEPKYLIISPASQRALLDDDEATSSDYQSMRALVGGYLENFMGFSKIIVSNRLLDGAGLTSSSSYNLAFTQRAIGLHVAGDIRARVAERPDMSFENQVYLQLDMDAVRVEDEHLVALDMLRVYTPA